MKGQYVLVALLIIASVGFASIDKPAPCKGYGDVNDDGRVTGVDKQWVLEYVVQLRSFDSEHLRRANVDLDSDVDSVDALKIDRYVQGMDPTLPGCTERPPCSNYGDVNRDGYVTYKDSDIVLEYVSGRALLDQELVRSADVDIDGDIDSADAVKIQSYADNIDNTFTACNSRLPPCSSFGDVNNDGVVRTDDAELVLRHVAGLVHLTPGEQMRANVDADADVDSVDALRILRYVSGLDNTFIVCSQTPTTSSTTTTTTTMPTVTTTIPCGYLKIFKFNDANANNIWEQGETPLPGFLFDIHGMASTSKTTGNGGVAVTDCIPVGQYIVTETVPSGWQLTSSNNKAANVAPGILREVRFGNRQVPAQTTSTIIITTTTITMPPITTTVPGTTSTTQPETCQNECSFWGKRECGNNNDYRICGNFDGDSCFEWGSFSSCGANKECVGGFCFPVIDGTTTTSTTTTTTTTTSSTSSTSSTTTSSTTTSSTTTTTQTSTCSNECSFWGQRACDGSNTRVCGNFDGDNCFEWRSAGSCNSDQTCVEGYCFPRGSFYTSSGSSNTSCTNECGSGERRCNGNNVETCGNYDSDSCYEWRFDRYCPSDQTCRNGDCTSCRDECGPQGLTDCNGPSIYMLCGNFDSDPCNEWFSASCGRGQICSGRRCIESDSYPTPPPADGFSGSTRTVIEQPVIQMQPVAPRQTSGIDPIMLLLVLLVLLALGAGAYFFRDRLGTMGAQITGEKEESPTQEKK